MSRVYDVVIVGSGIAGLSCAIMLTKHGLDCAVFTKSSEVDETATLYAQGGIIAEKSGDTPETLAHDIWEAGCRAGRREAIELLSREGPGLVFSFLIDEAGIAFSTDAQGNPDYTTEAAHSAARIVHYRDHTGEAVQKGLTSYAGRLGVAVHTGHTAIDLITNNHHSRDMQEKYRPREVMGLYVLDNSTGEVKTVLAHRVVIASGGIGNLYQHTTNPPSATGDGISMAYRSGADVINAEYVQFHPTALYHKDIKRFLISESIRGEGARLVDHQGHAFMDAYSPLGDLAPRDVVSRAVYDRMRQQGKEYMLLDLAHTYRGSEPIEKRFSNTYETCLEGGIDITREPIPVVPAAHYFCGGIKSDCSGRSSLKNLYAIGEASCTGLHGANRLASTSLLEGLLWAHLAAADIRDSFSPIDSRRLAHIPDWETPKHTVRFDPLFLQQDFRAIQMTLWNYCGIIRTTKGLQRARADIAYYAHRILSFYHEARLNRDIIELRHGVCTAGVIVDSAIHNTASLGCHCREANGSRTSLYPA